MLGALAVALAFGGSAFAFAARATGLRSPRRRSGPRRSRWAADVQPIHSLAHPRPRSRGAREAAPPCAAGRARLARGAGGAAARSPTQTERGRLTLPCDPQSAPPSRASATPPAGPEPAPGSSRGDGADAPVVTPAPMQVGPVPVEPEPEEEEEAEEEEREPEEETG